MVDGTLTRSEWRDKVDLWIGFTGAALLLTAYAASSLWASQEVVGIQLLNFVGACGLSYSSFRSKAYPAGLLNVFWALVATITLLRSLMLFAG